MVVIFSRDGQQDLLNAMGSMFAAILFLGFCNTVTVLPVVDVERTVFYREKAAGMYSALPYAFAQVNTLSSTLSLFEFLFIMIRYKYRIYRR